MTQEQIRSQASILVTCIACYALGQERELLRSDSRAPYVHRITLYDHDGEAIDPTDETAPPYSPRTTCGKCHPYGQIRRGWHFNADIAGIDAGRPGEPWILADALTGTQIPVSNRGWAGTLKPEQIGLSRWDFTLRFGRHFPGGGFGDPPNANPTAGTAVPPVESQRWGISGTLEIDCMFCHSADSRYDPAEASRQIEKENFKWAPTAALGLAVIRGEAKKMPDDWDPFTPADPDFPERAPPTVIYDASRFDGDDRVFFDTTLRPSADRCYFCHSFRQVGAGAPPAWLAQEDVHLAAGMLCTDCHRTGIDHKLTRGYEGEPNAGAHPLAQTLTCRGCHLGTGPLWDGPDGKSGRLGAPYPEHKGMPLVHFEKLTCTACHSGPWPEDAAKRFQTSMSHGLGLPTRDRKNTDPPTILGPIFARQPDGRIAPHRMIWPAYWGVRRGATVKPLPFEAVRRAAEKDLKRARAEHSAELGPLTDEEMTILLTKLKPLADERERVAYVRDGLVFWLSGTGKPMSVQHVAASPYLWPIGHDVRPASQSLGVRSCADCHAEDAPIFTGKLAAADEEYAADRPLQTMADLRGDDESSMRVLGMMFRGRDAFKVLGFVCVAILVVVLVRHGGAGVGKLFGGGR